MAYSTGKLAVITGAGSGIGRALAQQFNREGCALRLSDIDPATHSPLVDIAAHRPWIPKLEEPKEVLAGIYVVEMHGSLFFGNSGPLQRKLGSMEHARSVVLHMGDVRYLDQSGVYALADLITDLRDAGTEVYFAELHEEPRKILANLGVAPGVIPEDHTFERAEDAIREATRGEKMRLDSGVPLVAIAGA